MILGGGTPLPGKGAGSDKRGGRDAKGAGARWYGAETRTRASWCASWSDGGPPVGSSKKG